MVQISEVEGTPIVKRTSWWSGLSVTGDGVGVVAHTGSITLRLLAERTGLVKHLSKAMARRSFVPVHARGQVLTDAAVMLADGGEAISDINVLRHQSQVLLTCTGLVTQAREHCGDVVGDGGFGVELLAAGDADGDVLQGA